MSQSEKWTLCLGPDAMKDAAIHAAVEDLQRDGEPMGIAFRVANQAPSALANVIVVGDATRNPAAVAITRQAAITLGDMTDPQGYEIVTEPVDNGRVMVVAGGSLLGDVYGLYWVWDRMRVHGAIPTLNVRRSPAFPVRMGLGSGRDALRNALRLSVNWFASLNTLDLVPWNVEPEATRNAQNREEAREFIAEAHSLHLKFFGVGDEFSYHPSLLDELGARPDVDDPRLWEALQEKYRRLLTAMPELDGVRIRIGESTRVGDNYVPYDVVHEPSTGDWSLEKRYRTFVQKIHEVVVGEFDKIYYHRTWVTNATEQHSKPDVFKKIFTDEVPTKNLYLSPYLSTTDRWYYQPYNPTFNLTPHNMIALMAHLDYHAQPGVNVFPSFPGQYHQGGLRTILASKETNLRGFDSNVAGPYSWDTLSLTAYVVYRLAWNPDEDLRVIAHDYASIHLGPEVADGMAEILLLSHRAYKDGIYIKPVAEALTWNTLPHLRLTIFPARGFPQIDRGGPHIAWLQSSMYAPSKPYLQEALAYLDRGLASAVEMERRYEAVKPHVRDTALAGKVGDSLQLTRLLVETMNRYVKTCFAYFQYREASTSENREKLATEVAALKDVCERFRRAPGFVYSLQGIEPLIENADRALEDLEAAERLLENALDEKDTERIIVEEQTKHARALESMSDRIVKLLHWRGRVSGRDILLVHGDSLEVEHLGGDAVLSMSHEFFDKLPAKEVAVLVRDVESRRSHPFVLEQPSKKNDYTAKVFLVDRGRGYGWFELELYYIDAPPADLGLAVPWQE